MSSKEGVRVAVFLFGVKNENLHGHPLEQFMTTEYSKKDLRDLIASTNNANESGKVEEKKLDQIFDALWPKFEAKLRELEGSVTDVTETESEIIQEEPEPPEEQIKILKLLAQFEDDQSGAVNNYDTSLSNHLDIPLIPLRYHLTQLENRGLISILINMHYPTRHILSNKGRSYLIENGLYG